MPYTVWSTFDQFRRALIDLGPDVTAAGRSSRDFLSEQLSLVSGRDPSFARLTCSTRPFGSFARRTKIQPLDDIDLLILLQARGTIAQTSTVDRYTSWLYINDQSAPLAASPDGYGFVHSTRVLNAIKLHLSAVSHYRRAEIKRTGQAVTLSLSSRPWVFDIVPAVPVNNGMGGTAHFLIPDGRGNWIRTDPRIDDDQTTKTNAQHGTQFLPTVRLLKYWNRRTHKPCLPSYYFETLAIKAFSLTAAITDYPTALKHFFDYAPTFLIRPCPDPKDLGPALDVHIDRETKNNVAAAMADAAAKAARALLADRQGQVRESITLWGQIFGPEFPTYGT